MNIKELVQQMTLEEKAGMCSGASSWLTKAVERLNIPAVWLTDGPHGLRKQIGRTDSMGVEHSEPAVSFPAECATASSFDRELLREIGETLGEECQAEQVQVLLGPGVNIKRSPLCGRNFEYFSEDPLVAGELGAAYVEGLQSKQVGACVKHFCLNNQETRRMTSTSEADERTLREIYLPAFERVVKKAKPWSVMASYNRIGGKYATECREIMTDILRKEWGFDGCLISDWGAVHSRARALAGGTDLTMPGEPETDGELVRAVQAGMLPEALLDTACERILKLVFRGTEGRLSSEQAGKLDFGKGHALSRRAETESAVLLKNDGILPLSEAQRIVFIGEQAVSPRYQGGGSSNVNTEHVVSAVKAAEGMRSIRFVCGYEGMETDDALIAEAAQAAGEADVAVVFIGLPPAMESEGIDRTTMALPDNQNRLAEAVLAANPRTVVVLHTGSPVELPWADRVSAILQMYYGGEGIGEAALDLLFGKVNPSGHLAETWPLRLEDNPSYLFFPGDRQTVEYREGVYVGYRYYESKRMPVRYPFGHGLSYTTFRFDNLCASSKEIKAEEELTVTVDVTNTGKMAGKALTQLYVAVKECAIMRPKKELRGFEKVSLQPGETQTITFRLDKRDFSFWDTDHHCFRMPEGVYELQIGYSAHDVAATLEIAAEEEPLKEAIEYTMMSLVGDMVKHPVGNAFFESKLDELAEGIMKTGISAHAMGRSISREEIRGKMKGLYSQPLTTLKMFLPGMKEEEWQSLLAQLNQHE